MDHRARVRWRPGRLLGIAAALVALSWSTARAAPLPSFGHAVVVRRDGAPQQIVDGKPFFFWGGAFFYERIPPSRWRASMRAMRDMGVNTLDLYVPWNWHEVSDGAFDFDGHTNPRRNLREVLRLARAFGFHLIVRPGPVIRNEWRNGGYPAWLLARPEYDMPLRDVLDGRYPASATLQNAHSDDAAREWLNNPTHLRYSARWLRTVMAEFRPVADLVLAVQLDDDQGAYIDNQTDPAPHLQHYLRWLDAQVRTVIGPRTPTFINTYEMRVPATSPVWTMGNWYQSDAEVIGEHDRSGLDFATALLSTNTRGPLAQSEFQAGWLAAPEDPQPRPADPTNTTLALHELLAAGVHGVVDFPLQDTLAPFGWEAPFANALYAWDAALDLNLGSSDRWGPTRDFGVQVTGFGQLLAETRPVTDVAIAWMAGAYARPLTIDETAAVMAGTVEELRRCRALRRACRLVDPHEHVDEPDLVVPANVPIALAPDVAAALARQQRRGLRVDSMVPSGGKPVTPSDATLLRSARATFLDVRNWSNARRAYPAMRLASRGNIVRLPPFVVGPRAALLLPVDVDLAGIGGFRKGDTLGPTTCAVELRDAALRIANSAQDCSFSARVAGRHYVVSVEHMSFLRLTAKGSLTQPIIIGLYRERHIDPGVSLSPHDFYPHAPIERPPAMATAVASDVFEDGGRTIVMTNGALRVIVSPDGGGRVVELGDGARANATDATGALRDDLAQPALPSARDYIAAYTHSYPAGTAQRPYEATIESSGPRAVVRLRYVAADFIPACTFERVLTLEPGAHRLIVDERVLTAGTHAAAPATASASATDPGASAPLAVQRSSLPGLFAPQTSDLVLDDVAGATARGVVATYRRSDGSGSAHVTAVAWKPGDVRSAEWTPYRSTGTLALILTPMVWHRVIYAFAPARDAASARAFAEAERAWVSANPPPSR